MLIIVKQAYFKLRSVGFSQHRWLGHYCYTQELDKVPSLQAPVCTMDVLFSHGSDEGLDQKTYPNSSYRNTAFLLCELAGGFLQISSQHKPFHTVQNFQEASTSNLLVIVYWDQLSCHTDI